MTSPNRVNDLSSLGAALPDLIELGVYHVEAGARDFVTWSGRLLDDIGESVTLTPEHLNELYARSRERAGLHSDDGGAVPASAGRPPVASRVARGVSDVLSLPKAFRASFDWSAVGRQGLPQILAHPTFLKKTLREQAKATVSQAEFDRFALSVREHPDFTLMQESGLDLSTTGGIREEAFASRLAESVPGVKQSSRAYSAAMDSLRVQAWDFYAKQAASDPRTTPETYAAIAELINITTGRGRVPLLDRSARGRAVVDALNLPFFSPRTSAARFNVLSPARIIRNAANPATRSVARMQVVDGARAMVTLGTTLALVDLIPGVDVTFDLFDSEFGKVRIGKRVYDTTGGMSNTARYMARLFRSFADIEGGKRVEAGKTPVALTQRFLRSQLSPSGSVGVDAWTGETFNGEEFTKLNAVADLTVPMVAADFYEAWKDAGGSTVSEVARSVQTGDARGLETGFSGLPFALPAVGGVGFKIYEKKPGQAERAPLKRVLASRAV